MKVLIKYIYIESNLSRMLYIEDVDESIKYIYIESDLSRMLFIEDVDESKQSTSI